MLPAPAAPPLGNALGVVVADAGIAGQLAEAARGVDAVCAARPMVEDPAAELILPRASTSVARITHLLRAAEPAVPRDLLVRFDDEQGVALGAVLGGALFFHQALDRASCAARGGGPGLRRAVDLQFPASLASRAEACPLVERLAKLLPDVVRAALWAEWGRSSSSAFRARQAALPESAGAVAEHLLEGGADSARGRVA